ncbi:MAG TPA: response regulator transcription factor [Solirubrobacteraceae bacterium]|nr:response regulator transcription factor [Solirubrobacteraceae bacterium]
MADPLHSGLVVVHPDPVLRGQIVAALTDRGYPVAVADTGSLDRPAQRAGERSLTLATGPHVTGGRPRHATTDAAAASPVPTVVIVDHTQLPVALPGQLLVLVPADEQGAILAAFAAGADDVLAGPLRPAELATRVAILARTAADASRLVVGPITIDTLSRAVTLAGNPLELTRTEYQLLTVLASAPGRVFTKHELLHAIADPSTRPTNPRSSRPTRRVDTQAARLRRRLGDHRGLLVTVWGVGYRLG